MKRALLLIALLASASACGGNSSGPSEITPAYGGTWNGSYTVSSCTQNGGIALANICGTASTGAVFPATFKLTQSGRVVAGQFLLGSVVFQLGNVTISSDGSLTLQSSNVGDTLTIAGTWILHLSGVNMSGTLSDVWTSTGLTGQATINGTMTTMTRTSTTVTPSSFDGPSAPVSVREAIDAIGK